MSVVGEKLPETQGVKCPELVHGRKFPVGSPMDWEDPTHDYVFAIKGNDGEAGTEYWIRSKGGMLTDPRDVPPDWVDIDELYRFWDPPRPLVDGGWEGPDNQPRRLDSLPIWWPMDSSQRQRKRRYEEEKENMKTKKMNIKGLRCRGLGPSVGEDVGSNFGFVDQLNKINPDIGEDAEQASHAATGMTSAHIAEGLGLDGCLDRLTSFNKFKEEDVRLCEHLNDWLQQQLFHPLTQDQWERVTAAKRALGEDAAPVEALGRFCDDTSFQESVDHSAFDKAGLTHSLGEDTDRIMRQAGWFDVIDEEGHEEEEDPLGETAAELRRMVLSQFAARKEQD